MRTSASLLCWPRVRPEREFTQILQMGRPGETGETYAINKDGLMVSNSRFDEQLIDVGLLPDTDGAESILNISLRDPGGDMTRGFRPKVRRAEQPLTPIAAATVSGKSGVLTSAYRDYRGVRSVGACTSAAQVRHWDRHGDGLRRSLPPARDPALGVLLNVRSVGAEFRCYFLLYADCRSARPRSAESSHCGPPPRPISPGRKARLWRNGCRL